MIKVTAPQQRGRSGSFLNLQSKGISRRVTALTVGQHEFIQQKKGYLEKTLGWFRQKSLYCLPPSFSFHKFTSLTKLVLAHCYFNKTFPTLPNTLKDLEIHHCNGSNGFSQSKLTLKGLETVQSLKITESCFRLSFLNQPGQIQSITIKGTKTPYQDSDFLQFTTNIKEFNIEGAQITEKTLKKLPLTLQSLSVANCQEIGILPKGRLRALFPQCQFTGLPQETIDPLKTDLEKRVQGQPYAIKEAFSVASAMKLGLRREGRPIDSLLLVGPTGIGKTETAKAVAELTGYHLTIVNMAGYKHSADLWRLRGPSSGHINQGKGELTDAVRKYPKSVVLFDEIDRAHPDFFDILFSILDEGVLKDGLGRPVDFTQTVIILTSNLGAQRIAVLDGLQPNAVDQAKDIARNAFETNGSPALVGRVSRFVPYFSLTRAAIRQIVKSKSSEYANEIAKECGIEITIANNVVDSLLGNFQTHLGVRPVIENLKNQLRDLISPAFASGSICRKDKVVVIMNRGSLSYRVPR